MTQSTTDHARVIASYNREIVVELPPDGEVRPAVSRGNLPALIAGDIVEFARTGDEQIVIEALQPRQNVLEKVNRYGKSKLVASNVDYAVMVIAPEPEPYTELIDRYLVALHNADITPILLGNKVDLAAGKHRERFDSMLSLYRQLGVQTHAVSAKDAATLQDLSIRLHNKTAILLGQSGVGKSSLTRQLAGVDIRTQILSERSGFGKHTTTATTAYPLLSGAGYLIDSPGVRGFSPQITTLEELMRGYPEISAASENCRFRDCVHKKEPGCAVRAAIEAGQISQVRLDNFHHIQEKLAIER